MSYIIGRVLQIIFCFPVTNDDHPDYYTTVCTSRKNAPGVQAIYSRQKLTQDTTDSVKNSGDRRDLTSKWSCSTCVQTSEVALSRPPSVKQATAATNTTCDPTANKQRSASERTFHRTSTGARSNLRRISKFGPRNDREENRSRSRSNPRRVVSSYAFATISEEGFSLSSNRSYVTRNELKNVSSHTESEFMTRIKNKLYARESGFDRVMKSSNNALKRLENNKKNRRRVRSSKHLPEQFMRCENVPSQSVLRNKLPSCYCSENVVNESSHLPNLNRKSRISEPAPTISETTLEQLEKYTVFKSCYKSSNSGKSYQKFEHYLDTSNHVLPSMKSDRHETHTSEKPSQRLKNGYDTSNNAETLYERAEKKYQKSGESEEFSQKENEDFHYENRAKKFAQRPKNFAKPNSSVKPLKKSLAKLNMSEHDNSYYSSKTKFETSSLSITSTSDNNSDVSLTVVLTHSHKSMKLTSGQTTSCARSKTNSRVSESSWHVARHTESLPLLTTQTTVSSWSDDSSQSSD